MLSIPFFPDTADAFFALKNTACPAITSINHDVVYVVVYTNDSNYFIGPLRLGMKLEMKNNLVMDLGASVFEECSDPHEFHAFTKSILLFYNLAAESPITENDILINNFISNIASYLGFSSQSHLGNFFKASTGVTLK